MMQKEVADRISAEPGTKGLWFIIDCCSILYGSQFSIHRTKTVFVPQPNVDSAILKLTRRDIPAVEVTDEKAFFRLTKAAFQQRKKRFWNNLQHSYGKD